MSFSPRKVEGLPLYQDPTGYWVRPTLGEGRRVWRKLKAKELSDAVVEAKRKEKEQQLYARGVSVTSPYEESGRTFRSLGERYLAAGCPNSRGERRDAVFCGGERERIASLDGYFGDWHPNEIRLTHLPAHAAWRKRQCKHGEGDRVVELEWVTLSNVQRYGIVAGVVELAWVSRDRPRLRSNNSGSRVSKPIRHAREVAPRSGDEVHAVAEFLMRRRAAVGWFWLFACLTGLRRSELLRLRVDATGHEPGASDDRFLYVRRSKRSTKNTVWIYPELSELLDEHFAWHQEAIPGVGWFFAEGSQLLQPRSIAQSLTWACQKLGLPHFTPHGARAFFATKLRSDRLGEAEIASRIGDRTVTLIQTTYGGDPYDLPEPLRWGPKEGVPVWRCWRGLIATPSRPLTTFTDQPQAQKPA